MQLPGLPRRRPSGRVALALAGVAAIVLGAALIVRPTTPQPATSAGPTFTAAGGWSLLDLERHISAGDVAAITAASDTAGDRLIARTTDGQTVPIRLAVGADDAARALAALGYGSLLTQEAWDAAGSARSATVAPADPVRTLIGVAVPIGFLSVMLVIVLLASRGRLGVRQRSAAFPVVRGGTADAAASSGPGTTPKVRLADVAGCDEAKVELTEVIEFLREPERFARLGATIPRGVLLYGPPGTGKTMLAKAVAAEADVAFLHASGSEFVEKFVGVGARRVRDLFAQARQFGRAVVFVDEFDALAKARGGPNGHEEREQTLNQLLVELDGFRPNDNVVVIAATNRLDVLDQAVLRPGRFNRKIHVGLPDVHGRREILGVHARNKPLADEVDLDSVARKTYGFSGAQLADLLNEGAILTARRGGEQITTPDLQQGWLKVAIGTGRRRSMDERERAIIAAHEVGHAICGKVHGDRRRVEEISLFAHGEALGVTVSSQEDNDLPSESDLRARLVALMGGRAAEELLFHEVTGGASNDFEKATQIATSMVTRFGMGVDPDAADRGPSGRGVLSLIVPRSGNNLPSDVQPAATRAIRSILDTAYVEACDTLAAHLPTLRRIAAYLVEEERVDGETFDALFDGTIEVAAAEGEWRPTTARPREWADVLPFRDLRFRRGAEPKLVVEAEPVPVAAAASGSDIAAIDPDPVTALAETPVGAGDVQARLGLDAPAIADPLTVPDPEALDAEPSTPDADGPRVAPRRLVPRVARNRGIPVTRRRPTVERRLRRAAASWLRQASARVSPPEPPTA